MLVHMTIAFAEATRDGFRFVSLKGRASGTILRRLRLFLACAWALVQMTIAFAEATRDGSVLLA
jgi:hypothetical protein